MRRPTFVDSCGEGPPPRTHEASGPSVARQPLGAVGRIRSLNVSAGGVPKRSVRRAWIGVDGLDGDRQRNLTYHGGPLRAVSLYAAERIAALQAEGHPVVPGSLGENVTVEGLDWDLVVPGVRLALGDEVVLEVASYTVPCRTIAHSFGDRRPSRVSQKLHPGWSRVYASVLRAGYGASGDRVAIV